MLGLGGLIVVGAVWIAVTALLARTQLRQAQDELKQVRSAIGSGDLTRARTLAGGVQSHAHRAHSLTTGPAWWVGASVPGAGDPLRTVRGVADAVNGLSNSAVPQLIALSDNLDPSRLKVSGSTINLSALTASAPEMHAAAQSTSSTLTALRALPGSTWLGSVDSARSQAVDSLAAFSTSIDTIDQTLQVAPELLGANGPQRYFVGFQNEAEARGSGGLPGAFAILVADHGKLEFTHFGNDGELDGISVPELTTQVTHRSYYSDYDPSLVYLNSTVSPSFPDAGAVWAAMWQKKSGEHVDGALSLDPTALSYLLQVAGPTTTPDGTTVSASNVVALTQSTAYLRFGSDVAARKAFLQTIARAADQHILGGLGRPTALIKAAGRAASERRLLLWSTDPAVQRVLSSYSIGGTIPQTDRPFGLLSVSDYLPNKLTYYLDRTMTYTASGCAPNRTVTVTATFTNRAPAGGLTSYVAGTPPAGTPVGSTSLFVDYLATTGATLVGGTVDGKPVGVDFGMVEGHPAFGMVLVAPRGRTTTVTLTLREPAGSGSPLILKQPAVRPLSLTVKAPTCGS